MEELETRRRRDALTVATAVVLLLLGAVSAWAVISLSSSTAQVSRTTERVAAYQNLQEAVAAQAFAEAGYRRAPSPAAELRLEASITDVSREVTALRLVVPAADGAMLSYLEVLNARYVNEARRTLDTGPATSGSTATTASDVPADDRVAGPALDAVQQLVHAAIQINQDDASAAVARERSLVATLALVLPGVMVIAAAALTTAVRSQRARSAELVAAAAEAQQRATHDTLTGLLNRAGFDLALTAAFEVPRPGDCLLLVDLDHFKGVNDAHGHAAGDAVLQEVSSRMRDVLRPADILARLGGDEFAVLLRDCADPVCVGQRLCDGVAQPMQVAGTVLVPTISVGAAVLGPGAPDRATALHTADLALYRAKHAGRARACK